MTEKGRYTDAEIIERMEREIAEGRELEGYKRVPARVSKNLSVSYPLRLSAREYAEFNDAAKARNMTLAEFLRVSARAAIAGEIDATKGAAISEAREKVRELSETLSRI